MIRVKITPPYGGDRTRLDARGWAELPDGARLSDALRLVHVGSVKAKLLLVSVNGERAACNTVLHDGDVVGFFSLISGG